MSAFTKILHRGDVLLMDGAMGTQLRSAGLADSDCLEACNLLRPDKVLDVHRSYVTASSEILLTNTFQANSFALARHRQEQNLTAIIQAGVALAGTALAGKGLVLASIGPLPTTTPEGVKPILDAMIDADGILLETFSDPMEAAVFAGVNQSETGPKKPFLVSFTYDGKTLRTFKNKTPEKCAFAAQEMGATALGVNCGRALNLSACAQILTRYRAVTSLPLFVRPNGGTPSETKVYPLSPDEMATNLIELLYAGAIMVGGCCGTTPQHIRAFRKVIDEWNAAIAR